MNWGHDSQIDRAKKSIKSSQGGPATDKHQEQTRILKLYVRAIIESETLPTVVQLNRKP